MSSMLIQQPLVQAQRLLSWLAGRSIVATNEQGLVAQALPFGTTTATPLFGGTRPWNESGKVTWVSVDDRVRGGSSQSHLETKSHDSSLIARFHGNLDTKTLGGAGFASVTTQYENNSASSDLSRYDGILIRITESDEKKYTFILKDDVPGQRDDGRMKSGVSWEYDFYGQAKLQQGKEPDCDLSTDFYQICIPWSKFTATYRGREVKDPEPLKTDQIKRYSLMARSFFTKQDGDFDITFHSIWAYSKAKEEEAPIDGECQSKSNL